MCWRHCLRRRVGLGRLAGRFGASLTRIAALAVGSALWRDHRQQVCGLRTYSSFSYLLSSTYPTPKNAHRNVNAFITRSAASIRISRRYRKYRTTYTLCEYLNFTSQRLFLICVKNMRANAAAKDFDEWFLGFAILSVDLSWLHFAWDQKKKKKKFTDVKTVGSSNWTPASTFFSFILFLKKVCVENLVVLSFFFL